MIWDLGRPCKLSPFLSSQVQADTSVLILAPSGLIYNWADEFQKFAPDLDVVVVHGLKSHRESILAENHQIYVTSYATFRQDSEIYRDLSFDFLFLDEATSDEKCTNKNCSKFTTICGSLCLCTIRNTD